MALKDSDRGAFAAVLAILAVPYRVELDDLTIEAFFVALEDYPLDRIRIAARHLLKVGRGWPTPGEWHDAINATIAAEVHQTPWVEATERESRAHGDGAYCLICGDTGWSHIDLANDCTIEHGDLAQFAAEQKRQTVVRPCTCRPLNPAWQRQIAETARIRSRRSQWTSGRR